MAKPSIDLMILGALKERPMSAYEMDRLFEARAVRRWVRVSAPSIYRNLLRLREEGLVDGREEKGEAAPPRTVYAITEAGEARFGELADELAGLDARVDFDFTPVVANLYVMGEDEGRELLGKIKERYLEGAGRLERVLPKVARLEARANMELRLETYRLVANWVERFERDFYSAPEGMRGWVLGADGSPSTPDEAPFSTFDWTALGGGA